MTKTKFDGEKFGKEIVVAVKTFVDSELTPIKKAIEEIQESLKNLGGRIDTSEKNAPTVESIALKVDTKGLVSGVLEQLAEDVDKLVRDLVKAAVGEIKIEVPEPKSVDMEEVGRLIKDAATTILEPRTNALSEKMGELITAGINEVVKNIPVPEAIAPKELDMEDVQLRVDAAAEAAVTKALGNVEEAAQAMQEQVRTIAGEVVAEAIKALPTADVPTVDYEKVADEVGRRVSALSEELKAALPTPEVIAELVKTAVSELPAPRDGTSVTSDDVRPILSELVTAAVKALPVPKDGNDGIGLAGAMIDRDGELIVTLTNGTAQKLGPVVGKDGLTPDGAVITETIKSLVADHVKTIPAPRDAFGFDDLSVEYDGERSMSLVFRRGTEEKAFDFKLPIVLDKGVYRQGTKYAQGDGVTFGGSFWIAQKDTEEKPKDGADWRLSVKRGRDANGPVKVG